MRMLEVQSADKFIIDTHCAQALRAAAAHRTVQSLMRSVEGREGLLGALERAIKEDAPLRLQLQLLLRPTSPSQPRKQREH